MTYLLLIIKIFWFKPLHYTPPHRQANKWVNRQTDRQTDLTDCNHGTSRVGKNIIGAFKMELFSNAACKVIAFNLLCFLVDITSLLLFLIALSKNIASVGEPEPILGARADEKNYSGPEQELINLFSPSQ